MSEQTKLPWSLSDENRDDLQHAARFGNIVIYAEEDCGLHPVADCSCNHTCRGESEQVANAKFIVKACNNHYDLIEALKASTREIIAERDCLYDCHFDPVADDVIDEEGKQGLAELDAIINRNNAVLERAKEMS